MSVIKTVGTVRNTSTIEYSMRFITTMAVTQLSIGI